MRQKEFRPGDAVRLKGCPDQPMTVQTSTRWAAQCVYLNHKGKPKRKSYSVKLLEHIPAETPPSERTDGPDAERS